MYYAFTLNFDILPLIMKTLPTPSPVTYSVATALMLLLILLLIFAGILPSPV